MRIGRIILAYDEKNFKTLTDEGMQFAELCCNNSENMTSLDEAKEGIKALCEKYGIDISSVGRWNHTINLGSCLDERELEGYLTLVDNAAYLGARTFVAGINYCPEVSLYKNYSLAIDFFDRLIKRADGRLRIAIQNCSWNNFVVSEREWEIVLGELPKLGIKYDPSHAYNRGADYLAELSDFGERIYHFHLKGSIRAGNNAIGDPPAGMDAIDWRSVFGILYARGYRGDLSIEPHSAVWKGELVSRGVEFTKRFAEQFIV